VSTLTTIKIAKALGVPIGMINPEAARELDGLAI
jgi:hypothetical protein